MVEDKLLSVPEAHTDDERSQDCNYRLAVPSWFTHLAAQMLALCRHGMDGLGGLSGKRAGKQWPLGNRAHSSHQFGI